MKHQAIQIVAMMLGVLLAAAAPVRAGSIQFGDVAQTIVDGQNAHARVQLTLRAVSQSGRLPVASGTASVSGTSGQSGRQSDTTQQPATGGTAQTPAEGAPVQTGTSGQVQTVDLGDVTGTVCDCGEIPLPPIRRGLPLWPLLGGIPLICVTGICGGDRPPPTEGCVVNCTPPTTVPEPATLLLFGSGLMAIGAGARRRRARRNQTVEQATPAGV